jgi:hypothetical protein
VTRAALPAKLRQALDECGLHAGVLAQAAEHLPPVFDVESAQGVDGELRRWLDQAAYRFMKLQDSLGERVLPGLLAATLDPLPADAPFAQQLQRLERLGAIASAQSWRVLREVRNGLAHEYPDNPALQAASLTRFVRGIGELLATWSTARAFADRLDVD